MAAGFVREIFKRIKRKLYNNRHTRNETRMSYIYDPEGVLDAYNFVYLTIGSLVYYGPVTNVGKERHIGIIIDARYSDIVAGECMFQVYADGHIIETAIVYPVAEEVLHEKIVRIEP